MGLWGKFFLLFTSSFFLAQTLLAETPSEPAPAELMVFQHDELKARQEKYFLAQEIKVAEQQRVLAQELYQAAVQLHVKGQQAISEQALRQKTMELKMAEYRIQEMTALHQAAEVDEWIKGQHAKVLRSEPCDLKKVAENYSALWKARKEVAIALQGKNEAQLEFAEFTYEMTKKLKDEQAATPLDLAEANSRYLIAKQKVEQAKEAVSVAEAAEVFFQGQTPSWAKFVPKK